jgi:hypothetical protein
MGSPFYPIFPRMARAGISMGPFPFRLQRKSLSVIYSGECFRKRLQKYLEGDFQEKFSMRESNLGGKAKFCNSSHKNAGKNG